MLTFIFIEAKCIFFDNWFFLTFSGKVIYLFFKFPTSSFHNRYVFIFRFYSKNNFIREKPYCYSYTSYFLFNSLAAILVLYKNYSIFVNTFDFFLKKNKNWKKSFKNCRQIVVSSSQKNALKSKKLVIANYISLFLLFGNIPKKILLKKHTSFHRNRGIFFWGYSVRVSGKKFYEFYEYFVKNFLPKIAEYRITKLKMYSYGQKKDIGFNDTSFLDEFSETNLIRVRRKFGFNQVNYLTKKNWINVHPTA